MFKADRIYSQRNASSGKLEWYFQAREGNIGPYESRETAGKMLSEFIARCIAAADDGGRSKKASEKLSLVPLDDASIAFDPGRLKKGKENSRA
jgi:hypothetical protein